MLLDNQNFWNEKYKIENGKNAFLSEKMIHIRRQRPKLAENQRYTIDIFPENSTIQLWIQTGGCTFSKTGSCTMCDYWIGKNLKEPYKIVEEALVPYKNKYDTLIFNTCGSPFDEKELSVYDQEKIWEVINRMGFCVVIIETHALTITEEKLKRLKQNINAILIIEMGLESSNNDVLLYCLNKQVNLRMISEKIELVHAYSMKCCVNILLGIPFLNIRDRCIDCVKSINDVLRVGADTCAVFPINIKDYTLVKQLYDNDMYNRVFGRELVWVLNQFSEKSLSKINIAWAKERKQNNQMYKGIILPPYFCEYCREEAYKLLDRYNEEYDGKMRRKIVEDLEKATRCCEKLLLESMEQEKNTYNILKACYEYLEGI